jgi:Flp pilus assembly protein TadD
LSESTAAPVPGAPAHAAPPTEGAAAAPAHPPDGTATDPSSAGTATPSSAPLPLDSSHPSPTAGEFERAAQAQRAAESETLAEQGIHFCRSARWRAAIEPLRRATELDPTNVSAFYYLGEAYNHADTLPAALEAFEAAGRLQPEHWRALRGVGIVLDRMRRPQEATAAYQRAREAQSKGSAR